jgi:hypothetical protein
MRHIGLDRGVTHVFQSNRAVRLPGAAVNRSADAVSAAAEDMPPFLQNVDVTLQDKQDA